MVLQQHGTNASITKIIAKLVSVLTNVFAHTRFRLRVPLAATHMPHSECIKVKNASPLAVGIQLVCSVHNFSCVYINCVLFKKNH